MTKQGEKVSVKLSGLNSKKITVSITGDFLKDDTFNVNVPYAFDIEENDEGNYITTETPFLETLSSSIKNKKAVYVFSAHSSGVCALKFSISSDGIHDDVNIRLDINVDDNLNLNCEGIYIDEHSEYTELIIDEESTAYLEIKDDEIVYLGIRNSSYDIYVEGYDSELIEQVKTDSYYTDPTCSFEVGLIPLKEGEGSITLIDAILKKRYIAGISIVKDTLNSDVNESYIIKLDSIISEDLTDTNIDTEGDEPNEIKS